MSIDRLFDTAIYVQSNTPGWDGSDVWADRAGYNRGYIRVLSQRERASIDKPTLFSTHRAVMTRSVIAVYGQRLRIATSYYIIKGVDQHELSGKKFQTVDCEVVL